LNEKNNYLREVDPWEKSNLPYYCQKCPLPSTVWTQTQKLNGSISEKRKQMIIEKNKFTENAKCIPHTDVVGDKDFLKQGTENKYETPYHGPYTILQINDNGTVQMKVKKCCDSYNMIKNLHHILDLITLIMGESAVCGLLGPRKEGKIESSESTHDSNLYPGVPEALINIYYIYKPTTIHTGMYG
jgi:hypothetical protein